MDRKTEQKTDQMGLLAFGSSPKWDISIDESSQGTEWAMEFDGPNFYLLFNIDNLNVVEKGLAFLRRGATWSSFEKRNSDSENDNRMPLGRFGASAVSFVWDDEEFVRCFLVVGSQSRSSMSYNLYAEDIECLISAFEQVSTEMRE
jgi:hypothetical protein